jgi:RHS repeat-associated protein
MFLKKLAILAGLSMLVSSALAQDYNSYANDYAKLVSQASDVVMLDAQMFGDQESLYTGALSFSNTDASLPGIGPAVALTRGFSVKDRGGAQYANTGAFGDWELEVPHLVGTFAATSDTSTTKSTGWNTQYNGYSRCSGPTSADSALPNWAEGAGNGSFHGSEYWTGTNFVAPGGSSQELMLATTANPNRPKAGGPYKWVVNSQWFFSCLSKTANGYPGEGFLARGPDGSQIWLDHMAKRPTSSLTRQLGMGGAMIIMGPSYVTLNRQEVYLFATKVLDRFGNSVTYTYDSVNPGRLLKIAASDGRKITLSYNTAGRVQSVSDGKRKWTYSYTSTGSLQSVTLPDKSRWTYGLAQLSQFLALAPQSHQPDVCNNLASPTEGTAIGTVTHPSGATGTFTVASMSHDRSRVEKVCVQDSVNSDPSKVAQHAFYPRVLRTPTIVSKQISGPGIPAPETWNYTYQPSTGGSWTTDCTTSCVDTTWTRVRGPAGDQQVFTFGNRFRTDEGRLYRTQTSTVTGSGANEVVTLLRDEQTSFATAAGQQFPAKVGDITNVRGDWMGALLNPARQTKIVQQGVSFSRTVNSFDQFANPTSVTRASSGAAPADHSVTESTEYYHDLSKWVLGQVKTVKHGARIVSQTDFDSKTALPLRQSRFGELQATLEYNSNGTLASVTDARNNKTSYSSWYRGVPGNVTYATGETEAATINADGTLASVTDELLNKTSYSYDGAGRLSKITYPTGLVGWAPTTRSFAPMTVPEYGVPSGSWKQVVQTGNGRTSTYYDAQWRPVLTLTEDVTSTASRSFVVRRYDGRGRVVFAGYPVQSLGTVADSTLKGVVTSYDALDRVTQTRQDSELGKLLTISEYLSGFQTRMTNPGRFATTTAFQVFDQPSTNAPVRILLPEGVTTDIDRDAFGKPLSITRHGGVGDSAVSETRTYVYDASERLCKTINPESGATVVEYDAAGNIAWDAVGQALTTAACDRSAVLEADRSIRSYDARNRPTAISTPGGVADVITRYLADGSVESVTAANPDGHFVNTKYTYNNRGMLESETQTNEQAQFSVGYGYDANGHLSTLTYPDLEVVSYAPDALGRPTQVVGTSATYASNVRYYPNGAMSGFKYGPLSGGGPEHSMLQNARLLPARSQDMLGSTPILDDSYVYDANGNVLEITDRAQNIDRAMGYDGLDRLTTAIADNLLTETPDDALWGVGKYTYDALDNLRSSDQGTREFRYQYDANWRLAAINDPDGAELYKFTHDPQGNTIAKNQQHFSFDSSNRMNSAEVLSGIGRQVYRYDGLGRRVQTTDPDGKPTYWLYTQAGQVLYTTEGRRRRNLSYIYLNGSQIATRAEEWAPSTTVLVHYQMTDALGSPVGETASITGDTRRINYSPWGEGAAPVDGTGFTGHVMDLDTGLTYSQQRYYDPVPGRFQNVDPISARTSGDNFNRYAYGVNNPYKFVDPDGREAGGAYATGEYTPKMSSYDGIGTAADFLPVIGDAKGIYDAYKNPTLANVAAAIVGLAGPLGDVAAKGIKASGKVERVIELSTKAHGEAAAHAADAIKNGHPDVLTIARDGAPSNRSAATSGVDRVPGKQLDEYPPAMFKEGGTGASVRPINPSNNMSAGACIGNACRGLPNGAQVKIVVKEE